MISLFARVKNEYNVNEWMLYHYDIGFEHIYLYDDYDSESTSVKTQIMDIIDKNKYTIITIIGVGNVGKAAAEQAKAKADAANKAHAESLFETAQA